MSSLVNTQSTCKLEFCVKNIICYSFGKKLIVECDSSNAISLVSENGKAPWKFLYIFNEIRALSYFMRLIFKHVICSTNDTVVSFAKQGVDRDGPCVDI